MYNKMQVNSYTEHLTIECGLNNDVHEGVP